MPIVLALVIFTFLFLLGLFVAMPINGVAKPRVAVFCGLVLATLSAVPLVHTCLALGWIR